MHESQQFIELQNLVSMFFGASFRRTLRFALRDRLAVNTCTDFRKQAPPINKRQRDDLPDFKLARTQSFDQCANVLDTPAVIFGPNFTGCGYRFDRTLGTRCSLRPE